MTLIEATLSPAQVQRLWIPQGWTYFTFRGQYFARDAAGILYQHYGGQWRSVRVLHPSPVQLDA